MPTPREGESQKEFMKRCVPMMAGEGMENDQAVAACMNMFKTEQKALSFERKESVVRDAFYAMHHPPKPESTMAEDFWLVETYEDHVIARVGNDYYSIPYSKKDDDIEFAERDKWTEVEEKREWVEKVKALQAMRPVSNALKALSKTDDELRVGNYIVLFGGRDLEWLRKGKNPDGSMGEYFSDKTKLDSSYTKSGVLYLDWEHGAGKSVDGTDAPGQHDILGKVLWDTAKKDARGVWVERALNRRNEYVKVLEELIENDLIGTSSEAIQEGVKIKKTGEIEAWPLMRDTLTVTPAEPRMLTENVLQAAKALSDRMPSLKTLLPKGEPETPSRGGEPADDQGEDNPYHIHQLRAKAFLLELEFEE